MDDFSTLSLSIEDLLREEKFVRIEMLFVKYSKEETGFWNEG